MGISCLNFDFYLKKNKPSSIVVSLFDLGLDTRISSKSCLSYDESLLSYELELDFSFEESLFFKST